ncbi:unnamed protein product [Didymodactylos carnosus]|uniref:LIM zinc-binding domain-containing protein n=1 Tax=Didymodactylos carnosus TaxID=1234261 RepID=A0A814WW09_9BILA|nr:unnamed protein product [Didymodactylos carnosus]CAF1209563.1 unnamed protein product [Didymodactylos carnosus]CAF3872212.1 unnamed protein product [Didymodactylos carnosus]CAF3973656.1 unnamed protein product [Didymodactylos carnosus]
MPFKVVENAKCPKCNQNVYAAEEVPAAGKKWHKMCFKCGLCKKMLEAMTMAEHDGNVYCKQCFGQGAGTLGMDTGEHLGNKDGSQMTNKPNYAPPPGAGPQE